jgi:hypothetical protein
MQHDKADQGAADENETEQADDHSEFSSRRTYKEHKALGIHYSLGLCLRLRGRKRHPGFDQFRGKRTYKRKRCAGLLDFAFARASLDRR